MWTFNHSPCDVIIFLGRGTAFAKNGSKKCNTVANDKYHICHHLFKIQIKCKWKVDGVLDPFKSLLPPIFRKYKLKLRKLFVLNDDGDFVPRFQQIRRLWSQSAGNFWPKVIRLCGKFHHTLSSSLT